MYTDEQCRVPLLTSVDEGLNDPRGTVTPVQDLVQTADNEGEPPGGEERFDSLPSARVAALTNRRKKRKVAPSSSGDHALLPQGSESADTDVVPPMRRGHLRSHSARQHPRVVHFDPQQLRRTSSLPRNTSAAANIAITILDDINDRDYSKVSTLPLAQRIHYRCVVCVCVCVCVCVPVCVCVQTANGVLL